MPCRLAFFYVVGIRLCTNIHSKLSVNTYVDILKWLRENIVPNYFYSAC
uniref:Uncharacterized protein n=1 Tax=Arundo donax TaxID=35708 RepID=A0A0A9AHZ1_ARUDO